MKKLLLLFSLTLAFGCSKTEKTDKELLDQDSKALQTHLHTEKVIGYKFCKIMLRASADQDTTSAQHAVFRKELKENFQRLSKLDKNKRLSVTEYLAVYNDYQRMRSYIVKTDEDLFPTLSESAPLMYGGIPRNKQLLKGKAKLEREAGEHAALSALVLFSRDLGKEVSLYECSETDPALLEASELKSLLLFYRGFVFFEKGLYYLSEKEISQNINWLGKDRTTDFMLTRLFFGWVKTDNNRSRMTFLAMNYLFRGFDRMMMERAIDDKRSMEDFEHFLQLTNRLGLSNELTWSVEAYVHLKKGENGKAIVSLTKLKNSPRLSADQKRVVTESIDYLKNEDEDEVLNGLYDKVFIGRIASGYVYDQVAGIDWAKFLRKQRVPYAGKMIGTVTTFTTLSEQLEKLSNGETLKEAGNELKEEGESLWDDAKGLVE